MASFALAPHGDFPPHRPASQEQHKVRKPGLLAEPYYDLGKVQRIRALLDEDDTVQLGMSGEAKFGDIVAPVTAGPSKALDDRGPAARAHSNEAARMQ